MKASELGLKLSQLEQEYTLNKKTLIRELCEANNPYKVGDIFTDHIGSVLVEKIRYDMSTYRDYPCCVYYGIELKKDLTPKKSMTRRNAYQSNDIKNEQQK